MGDLGKEIIEICSHLLLPQKRIFPIKNYPGCGDCKECKYNFEENKKCKAYLPTRHSVYTQN